MNENEFTNEPTENSEDPGSNDLAIDAINRINQSIRQVFVGQEDLVRGLLVGVLAGGHVLIESNPGLGKTLLAKGVAKILGLDHGRIQFTPDLMPADITGSHIFNMANKAFEFRPGPIFTRYLLADEINRSPAKTHAAVLEAMGEGQVTMDGSRYELPKPFLVVATQNPIESEGTYQLPEAALDRFLLKLTMDYPEQQEEEEIVNMHLGGTSPLQVLEDKLEPVCSPEELASLQAATSKVRVDPSLVSYLTALVRRTRSHPAVFMGASPRAAISLLAAGRAMAVLSGRNYLVPDDIVDVAPAVIRHRLLLTPEAEVENRKADHIIEEILRDVEVPRT